MAYYVTDLADIFGFSARTLYRRFEEKKIPRKNENKLISEAEALKLAKKLGYELEFLNHLNKKKNGEEKNRPQKSS